MPCRITPTENPRGRRRASNPPERRSEPTGRPGSPATPGHSSTRTQDTRRCHYAPLTPATDAPSTPEKLAPIKGDSRTQGRRVRSWGLQVGSGLILGNPMFEGGSLVDGDLVPSCPVVVHEPLGRVVEDQHSRFLAGEWQPAGCQSRKYDSGSLVHLRGIRRR